MPEMKISNVHLDKAPPVPFDLDGKVMFSSEKLEIIHICLKPGEKINQHLQPFDVIFFILSGEGILETDEGNTKAIENTSIFVPAGVMRGWNNTGMNDFKVLVIKDLD
jgi:quercetin dioxygenase-like cupin family protein